MRLARLCFRNACRVRSTSSGLSSTSKISTPFSITGSPLQSKEKGRTVARPGIGPHPPAVAVDDALDDGQAHPRPLVLLGAVEALEDAEELVGVLHVEPDAVVPDEVHRPRAAVGAAPHLDPRLVP